MRIVAFETARVSLLFPIEEITPVPASNTRDLLSAIQERYQFLTAPNLAVPREELQTSGLKFEHGLFRAGDGAVDVFQFDVFSDGLVVSAPTTDVASSFLSDVLNWLRVTFSFRPVPKEARYLYLSQVVFELSSPLEETLGLEPVIKLSYQSSAKKHFAAKATARLARIDYEFDDLSSAIRVPRLTIERRAGPSLAPERFYSSAPLTTSEHVALLSRIEGLDK